MTVGSARGEAPPAFIAPQLATLVKEPPRGEGWLHELKLDGYRLLCVADGERSQIYSRNHKLWSSKVPSLTRACASLGHRAVLDGEAALLDERGRSSFQALVEAVNQGGEAEVRLFAFDLLFLDGVDLRDEPLIERKRTLEALLHEADGRLLYLPHIVGRGDEVFAAACRQGAEGIVSKRIDGTYQSRRTRGWQKVKCVARQELVVAGFTPPTHAAHHLGALVLGVYDDEGRLHYAGRVGTGFSQQDRKALRQRLEGLARPSPPFAERVKEPGLRDVRWASPELVAEVEFSEWTRAGKVRHPSFLGLREDKDPREVVREQPAV